LANELGVSLRTIYRDIETLKGQGADIIGEAGEGFLLRPGFTLPPLMLTRDEMEAFMLGMAWVADRGDGALQNASRSVLAKVSSVIPEPLAQDLANATMLVGPGTWATLDDHVYQTIRTSIRSECKLTLDYRDKIGSSSKRVVWPCAIVVFDHVRIIIAWCEMRSEFRHFRIDRVKKVTALGIRFPRRRIELMREWQRRIGDLGEKSC
jgi:predicted DNA-binding transcriptional regulator YafY